ncbi:MAG: prepilin peptidase [Bacteroidota bacterium]
MEILCYILGLSSALIIAYQDIKSREIHIGAFLLFLLGALCSYFVEPSKEYFLNSFINLGMVLIIILILFLLFRLRGKEIRVNKELGAGDLVMLGILCFWFSPDEFILFYAISLSLFSIFILLLIALKKIDRSFHIPLAGGLAIFFLLFFPLRHMLWTL